MLGVEKVEEPTSTTMKNFMEKTKNYWYSTVKIISKKMLLSIILFSDTGIYHSILKLEKMLDISI